MMKTQKWLVLASTALALTLITGCSKSQPPAPPTTADLEITNTPPSPVAAGPMVRLDARQGSKMRIEGTSNIHDWQVESLFVGGFLEVDPGFPLEPGQGVKPGKIQAQAQVAIPVRSLKSVEKDGKPYNDKMDEIMWEKLKMEQQPKIFYYLREMALKEPPQAKDAPYLLDTKGDLVVAGVTNTVSMPVSALPLGDKKLKLTGSTALKMTSFGIEPPAPKLLAGLIKTGDDVKIIFEWVVAQKSAPTATAANK